MNREPLVEDIQNYALNIVDTVREPLFILDTTLRVCLVPQEGSGHVRNDSQAAG